MNQVTTPLRFPLNTLFPSLTHTLTFSLLLQVTHLSPFVVLALPLFCLCAVRMTNIGLFATFHTGHGDKGNATSNLTSYFLSSLLYIVCIIITMTDYTTLYYDILLCIMTILLCFANINVLKYILLCIMTILLCVANY